MNFVFGVFNYDGEFSYWDNNFNIDGGLFIEN